MKEIPYIHILRSIACLMVVFLHSLPTGIFELHRLDSIFKNVVVVSIGLYFSNSIYKLGSCMAIVSYLTICLLIFLGQRYGDINFSHYVLSFLSIPSILMTLILFLYIKGIKINISSAYFKAIKNLSSLSFGIYLSHMVIYRCITANIYEYSTSWIFQILVFVTTFLGAWCLSFILSKFPFSKYIVGV